MSTTKADGAAAGTGKVDKGMTDQLDREMKAYKEMKEQRLRNKSMGQSEESHIQIMDKIFTQQDQKMAL